MNTWMTASLRPRAMLNKPLERSVNMFASLLFISLVIAGTSWLAPAMRQRPVRIRR